MTDQSNTQATKLADKLESIANSLPNVADCDGPQGELWELAQQLRAQLTPEPVALEERKAAAQAWADRHDVKLCGTDLLCAFEDAATVRFAAPSPVALQGRDELESRAVVEAEALEELGKTLSANDVLNTSARVIRELVAARVSLPAGGVVEPGQGEFFAYHPEMGAEFFATQAEAIECCEENLKYERGAANESGEWQEDQAEAIRWGIVLGKAKPVKLTTEPDQPEAWDYKLATTQPSETQGRRQMTEEELVACLVKSSCIGKVKMSYESGPYSITRPSLDATRLKDAIEAHHGIPASPQDGGANG